MFELPTKTELTRVLQDVANECVAHMARWKAFAERLDAITDQQFLDLGYTSGQVAYIRSLGVGLKNVELRYRNQEPLNSDDPSYFIKYMTRLLTV